MPGNHELFWPAQKAALDNDVALLSKMASENAGLLDNRCKFTAVPLYARIIEQASQAGSIPVLRYISEQGYDLNCSIENQTALVFAANKNRIETVKWLLDYGLPIDGLPTTTYSPLMAAITLGHDELASFLIGAGADVNRIHLRLFQTPLDIAHIWKRDTIAEQLKHKGAVSSLRPEYADYSPEQVLRLFIHTNGGPIMPTVLSRAKNDVAVTSQFAYFRQKKSLYLFTLGLNARHSPKMELSIILPPEWSPYDMSPSARFPVALLTCLMNLIVDASLTLSEADLISATDDRFRHLAWPPSIAGFYPVNFLWGHEKEPAKEVKRAATPDDVGPIELFSLMPVKATKKPVAPADIAKNRAAGWSKMTLKL